MSGNQTKPVSRPAAAALPAESCKLVAGEQLLVVCCNALPNDSGTPGSR